MRLVNTGRQPLLFAGSETSRMLLALNPKLIPTINNGVMRMLQAVEERPDLRTQKQLVSSGRPVPTHSTSTRLPLPAPLLMSCALIYECATRMMLQLTQNSKLQLLPTPQTESVHQLLHRVRMVTSTKKHQRLPIPTVFASSFQSVQKKPSSK